MPRAPAICVSHGGGPLPVLGDPNHKDIVYSLKNRVPKILKLDTPDAPRAIIVVTAHWSTKDPTISSSASHQLLYDYGGFPPESYKLKYPAPGAPDIAKEVNDALAKEGLKPVLDSKRGWDHGLFIPFLLIRPQADIPLIQLSVLESEDPEAHLRMGRALSVLRDQNIALVGSGFASFHNLRIMFALMQNPAGSKQFAPLSDEWSRTLTEALEVEDVAERDRRLAEWRKFPHAYHMHPEGGAEHFLPLLVTAGSAGQEDGKVKKYKDTFAGVAIWTYYWGDVDV